MAKEPQVANTFMSGSNLALHGIRSLIDDPMWQAALATTIKLSTEQAVSVMKQIMIAMVESVEETHQEVLGVVFK